MTRQVIYRAINQERARQQQQWNRPHDWGWGDLSHPLHPAVKVAVLTEELGEIARATLDNNPDQLRTELIQLAACCVAWLEGLGYPAELPDEQETD